MNIARRGIDLDSRCVVCNRLFEDGGHLFLQCKNVKACWRALQIEEVRSKLCSCTSPLELLEMVFALPDDAKMKSIAMLWCWWTERNKINHQERHLTIDELQFLILRHTEEWKTMLKKNPKLMPSQVQHWLPTPSNVVKINIDGSFFEESKTGGWGAIGRDHTGELVFAACGRISAAAEALQTELMALIHAVPVAEQLRIGRVIFSTDCIELKRAIESNCYDLARLGPLIVHAKSRLGLAFSDYRVEYSPRACNSPAHKLAALGGVWNPGSYGFWLQDLPPDVMTLVANDSVRP